MGNPAQSMVVHARNRRRFEAEIGFFQQASVSIQVPPPRLLTRGIAAIH